MASGQRYRNAFLIYNPRAGTLSRRGGQLLQRIIEALQSGGHNVTPVATTGPNTAADLARDSIERGADVVLAAGGDGTVNEVLNGVAKTDVPLGIIPAGTANVLGTEMGMRGGPVAAARALGSFVPRRVAAGLLHNDIHPRGRYFLCMAGAGLDARIVYELNLDLKARLGKGAYWLAGIAQVGRTFPLLDVEVQGRRVPCGFALASRVRNYGGDLSIARHASLLGDDFAVVVFEDNRSWMYLRYFLGVLAGRLDRTEGIWLARAKQVKLSCPSDPRIYIQVDGEYAGRLPATVESVPDALTLLMPAEFVAAHG